MRLRKATNDDCERVESDWSSIMRSMASHRPSPCSRPNFSICSTVVRPMPRAGVLITRSRLTESVFEEASFRYATGHVL